MGSNWCDGAAPAPGKLRSAVSPVPKREGPGHLPEVSTPLPGSFRSTFGLEQTAERGARGDASCGYRAGERPYSGPAFVWGKAVRPGIGVSVGAQRDFLK